MSATVGTYEIGLDTPIHMLTPRQLFEMQEQWAAKTEPTTPAAKETRRWLVNSVGELAEIIGTSKSTAYRMKADGVLDEAISQYGRWMCIDVDKVLETLRLSNRKRAVSRSRKRG